MITKEANVFVYMHIIFLSLHLMGHLKHKWRVYTVRNVIIDNPTRVSSTSVLHRWVGQMGSWYPGAKHRPGPQLVVCHRQADILQCVGGPAPIFVLSPSSGDRFCAVKFLIRRWKAKGLHWEIILILHITSLKSLRLRKLLDWSALAYWALLGPSWSFWVLTGPYLALLGLT